MEATGGREDRFKPTIAFLKSTSLERRRVDLNQADEKTLRRLKGIGPTLSRRIIEARADEPIVHSSDLLARGVLTERTLKAIRARVRGESSEIPEIESVSARVEQIIYRTPFDLVVSILDSWSGISLVRLQVESMSHSIDLIRSVSESERTDGEIEFDLPGMEAGPAEVEVSLFDNAGNKAYFATTLHIFHNPPIVWFWPSERSARLSRGAALHRSDGSFHCNSSFAFYNGSSSSTNLNGNMNWRVFDQSGTVIHSGSWNFGTISLSAWQHSSGWWFNFSFPPGSTAHSRLSARQQIRIEWRFTELGTGATVVDDLTWRAVVAVDVNMIYTGSENFSTTERASLFRSLRNNASSIYQAQDLDIGTIRSYDITLAQAGSTATINSDGEAEDLTEDWTVPNQAVDMFIVELYVGGVAGLSPRPGPCNKSAKGMNGVVVEDLENEGRTGVIMAHEIGHYLGLPHTSASNNLMNPSVDTTNTVLLSSQGNTMKSFPCFLRFVG